MELYEASQLSIKGEIILDEAQNFCSQQLEDAMKSLDDKQVRVIRRTLDNPYHKTVPFCNFKNFIDDFDGTILQELDFYTLQTAHNMEVIQISRYTIQKTT